MAVREDLRDQAVHEDGRGAGDLRRLPQEHQDRLREGVDHGQRDARGAQEHSRALQVDAQHVVLLGAVGLLAERLHRAAHAQLRQPNYYEHLVLHFGGTVIRDK